MTVSATRPTIDSAVDADGVLLATIDMTGRTMNVFSVELMNALDALIERVERDDAVRSVVVTSGKATFLAGADLVMVRGYCDAARNGTHAQMFEMCGRLGRQFVRIEASAKPWVAAVNGLALGGGLELALACRARLVADDARLQLGVPEVRWGLLPGAGGTQRLPRLAGFETAIDLLLSGRSVDPATALRFGIVTAVVDTGRLLEEAKAVAKSMQGQAWDARTKFPRLDQADVPAWSENAAREIALRHGVTAEDFARYPAYGAIVDSVLKGARLPLADATDVEMEQFLRLMFDPTAGRMVRTLFLDRLRAERELAPAADVTVEGFSVGTISGSRREWSAALARLKLPHHADTSLPPDTLEIVDSHGYRQRVALRVLGEPAAAAPLSQLVLAPPGPYGAVVEIVAAGHALPLAAAFVGKLRALPWATPGPLGILQQLRGLPLDRQAALAQQCAALPGFGDPAFLDVAACLSGVAPGWSGGPLTWSESP